MAVSSASAVALHLNGYVYMAQCSAHRIFLLAIPEAVQSAIGTHRHSSHLCIYILAWGNYFCWEPACSSMGNTSLLWVIFIVFKLISSKTLWVSRTALYLCHTLYVFDTFVLNTVGNLISVCRWRCRKWQSWEKTKGVLCLVPIL